MKTRMLLSLPLVALLLAPLAAVTAAVLPVVSWTFDEARETGTDQPAGERLDSWQGAIELVPGVRGHGLKFDGFTSRLVRAAKDLPQFGPALTVDGKFIPRGKDFRFGHRQTLEGTDLIVWIKIESQTALTFRLQPQP